MRLTTKVYLATALVATVGAASIGTSNIVLSYETKLSGIKAVMAENASMIDATSVDAISDAITIGEVSTLPMSINYVGPEGSLSLIHDDGPALTKDLDDKSLQRAMKAPIELGETLVSALELSNGGHLLFSSSIQEAQRERSDDINRTLILYLITLAGMVLLVWLTLRRDLRSIRRINAAALKIAEGDLTAELPDKRGNSEIEQLSRSLRGMVSKLQQALDAERARKSAMESFIGDASHELKTPLTVIRGYSELLTEADAELRKSASEKIVREVDKMTTLVNDLLLLARLGEKDQATKTPCNLTALVAEAAENLRFMNPDRKISLNLQEVELTTDSGLLERFLANAISNINRYVPVTAQAQFTLAKRGKVTTLTIEDAGPGLPTAAYRGGIRSFTRFDKSRSKDAGGSGLGMSIMAGIAENLGGAVKLSKSSLGGVSIKLTLSED